MLAIRVYACALTFLFLSLVMTRGGLGLLEASVVTSAILYLILDTRSDLQTLKNRLRRLEELEKQFSAALH